MAGQIPNKSQNSISEITKYFKDLTLEDLAGLSDIGPIVAKSIYDWWHSEKNLELLGKLERNGVRVKVEKLGTGSNKLEGKTFVLTGTLTGLTRDEAKVKIRELGGDVSSSVSKNTDYVVAGTEPGSKYEKGKKLGVKIVEEEEFLKMI